jgi:hypothetical protein
MDGRPRRKAAIDMRARAGVIGRRACAVLAAASAVLHGMSLGHAANPAAAALVVAMLAACLYCARDLWVSGTLRGWALVASMNLAMIAIHLPASSGHHHGGGVAAAMPPQHSIVMTVATAFAALEAVLAAAVLYYRSRGLRPDTLAGWPGPTTPIASPLTTPGSSDSNRRRSPVIR